MHNCKIIAQFLHLRSSFALTQASNEKTGRDRAVLNGRHWCLQRQSLMDTGVSKKSAEVASRSKNICFSLSLLGIHQDGCVCQMLHGC